MEPIELIEWSDDFLSGIDEIDAQHKDIINNLNKLYFAVGKRNNEEEVLKLIKELDCYVSDHFPLEEDYAQKYNFPQIDELKQAHEFFRRTYNELKRHYESLPNKHHGEKPEYLLSYPYMYGLHLHSVMKEWLVLHLYTLDIPLFNHLRGKL